MSTIGVFLSVNDSNRYALKTNLQNLSKFDTVYLFLNNIKQPLDFSVNEFRNVFMVKSNETVSLDESYKILLDKCDSDYFGMLDPTTFTHGDIVLYLKNELSKENYLCVYTDEGYIINENTEKQHIYYYYKGDFDSELLYCQNYINRFAIYNTKHAKTLNVFNNKLNKNSDWAFALEFCKNINPKHIKHIEESLVATKDLENTNSLPYLIDDEKETLEKVIKNVIKDTNREAELSIVDNKYFLPSFKVKEEPKVSIVILTKDKLDYLKPCIDSILELTTYKNYNIVVVDNNSELEETKEYINQIAELPNFKVFRYEDEFDFAKIHNLVINRLDSDYVCLLNNDTKVINPNWLTEMVGIALDPAVATVGAKLLYEDNTIQHAGVLVNVCGLANHAYSKLNDDDNGYWHKLKLVQNYYANTAACLLVNTKYYKQLKGMDLNLPVTYNDVDLGMVFKTIGLRNVWSPLVKLHHYESKSRPNDLQEPFIRKFADAHIYMRYKHGKNMIKDPFYNRHFDNMSTDYKLKSDTPVLRIANKEKYLLDIPYGIDFYNKQWYPFSTNSEITFSAKVPKNTTENNKDNLIGFILPIHQHSHPTIKTYSKFKIDFTLNDDKLIHSTEGVSTNAKEVTFIIHEKIDLTGVEKINVKLKLLSSNTNIHLFTFYGDDKYSMYMHNSYRNRQFRFMLLIEES